MRKAGSPFLAFVKGTRLRLAFAFAGLALVTLLVAHAPRFLGIAATPGAELAAAAAGLVIGAVLAYLAARRLSRPIDRLAATVRSIAGDRAAPDEAGDVAATIQAALENLRASTARITDLSSFDAVTGLPNKHVFLAHADSAVGSGTPGGLLVISFVNARRIAETFGDETAEAMLVAGVERLLSVSPVGTTAINRGRALDPARRDLALLARVGSQDLALILPGVTNRDDLSHIASYLHVAMNRPLAVGPRQLVVALSIGIARYPEDTCGGSELLRLAALACRTAARKPGEQRTAHYDPLMRDALEERDMLEAELRRAMETDGLQVHYQPKVYVSDWSLSGVEALVRWRHTERGLIMPADFIPVAEETGLIVELGLFVIDKAVEQCAQWARAGRLVEMAVNVSPAQFRHPDFSRQVLSIIARHGCPPTLVTFEITEEMALADIAVMERHVAPLRQAGIRFAIDDFGIGYSNFARLSDLRFDQLKIDRSLVAALETEGPLREVSRAIVDLGKALGCRIVAEGAETPGQVAAASTLGCDEIQGFYVSHPMALAEFEAWQAKRGQNHLAEIVRSIFGPDFATDAQVEPAARRAAAR